MPRLSRPGLLAGAAVAIAGLATAFAVAPRFVSGPPKRASSPAPLDPWGIPTVAVSALPEAEPGLMGLESDGHRLYALRGRAGRPPTHLLRLDTRTGRVVAQRALRPQPDVYGSIPTWAATGSEIVVLDGDRSHAVVLDPDTLAERGSIPLPVNTRSELTDDGVLRSVWVSHDLRSADLLAGNTTATGVTLLDLASGTAEPIRPVPSCGAWNAVQRSRSELVIVLSCTNQIGILDLDTDELRILPSIRRGSDLAQIGDEVWMRWDELGFLGVLRYRGTRVQTLDLNADGPLLKNTFGIHRAAGSVWVHGRPADPGLPDIVYRIDPERFVVTARAYTGWGVAVTGERGFTLRRGRLAAFDPSAVDEGAPDRVVRPSIGRVVPYRPRSAIERAVDEAFTRVFDPTVPNAVAAPYLEDAGSLAAVRTRLAALTGRFPGIELVVTDIAVHGPRAGVAYGFEVNGTLAFVPLTGSARRVGNRWVVTRASVCRLAAEADVTGC